MTTPSPRTVARFLRATSVACVKDSLFLAGGVAAIARAASRPPGGPVEFGPARRRHATLVVLVHGFAGSKTNWSRLHAALSEQDVAIATFGYRPFGCSIDELVSELVDQVTVLVNEWKPERVVLVGHSLGGILVVRALADEQLSARVDVLVTIGAPFGGSPWAHLFPIPGVVRELRSNSLTLRELAALRVPPTVRWLSFTSPSDLVVPAERSELPAAPMEQVSVDGVGHCAMLWHPDVIGGIIDAVAADPDRRGQLGLAA